MTGCAIAQRCTASVTPCFYAVCGWDAVMEAVNRVEDFSSNLTATMVYHDDGTVTPFDMGPLGGPKHALATADDPVHDAHRKMLLPHLSARRIRIIEEFAEDTSRRLWSEALVDGQIEWMSAIANRLPMMVVARLLGLPEEDVDKLIRLGYATTTLLDGIVSPAQLEAAGLAVMELSGYVLEHFAKAGESPEPGLIGDLAARYESGELEQFPALGMMLTLVQRSGRIHRLAYWVVPHGFWPAITDIQGQVRANPELLGAFIEETLRYESPFRGHYRHVLRDTTLAGVDVPADSRLLLMWGAANRDPQQFDTPNEFRLDRSGAKGHVTFGKGAHFCVGRRWHAWRPKSYCGCCWSRPMDRRRRRRPMAAQHPGPPTRTTTTEHPLTSTDHRAKRGEVRCLTTTFIPI